MSWDAGAITGRLELNVNEYAHGMLQAEGLARMFPGVVLEFLENPLLGVIETCKELATGIGEIVADVAKDAVRAGTEAEKAGVSVKFFTELEEVGKRVNVSGQSIGDSLKFLNRSMVEALQGNEQFQQSFAALGISVDYMKSHLNDTEGTFEKVFRGMQALPDAAQRTRVAMELLGRGGADVIPIFNMSADAIARAIDTAHRFGATMDDEEVASGKAFQETSVEFDEMWEGLKKELAQPILKYLSDHAEEAREVLLGMVHVLSFAIPPALDALAFPLNVVVMAWQQISLGLEKVASLTDRFGWTDHLADKMEQSALHASDLLNDIEKIQNMGHELGGMLGNIGTGGPAAVNVKTEAHFNIGLGDESKATSQLAAALAPKIREGNQKAMKMLQGAAFRAAAAANSDSSPVNLHLAGGM